MTKTAGQTRCSIFLCLASYCRRFIHGFSQISGTLAELMKNDVKWYWANEQKMNFLQLKTALATAPVLRLPGFDHLFVMTKYASDIAIGEIQ